MLLAFSKINQNPRKILEKSITLFCFGWKRCLQIRCKKSEAIFDNSKLLYWIRKLYTILFE